MKQDNPQRDEQPKASKSEVTIPIVQEELAVGKTVKPAGVTRKPVSGGKRAKVDG